MEYPVASLDGGPSYHPQRERIKKEKGGGLHRLEEDPNNVRRKMKINEKINARGLHVRKIQIVDANVHGMRIQQSPGRARRLPFGRTRGGGNEIVCRRNSVVYAGNPPCPLRPDYYTTLCSGPVRTLGSYRSERAWSSATNGRKSGRIN